MIEGKQILAARALLGWRREDLVRVSGVSVSCTAAKIKRPPSDDILSCFFELGVIEMEARNGENLV